MTDYHLAKILDQGLKSPIKPVTQEAFKRFFEPEYYIQELYEYHLNKYTNFLVFDYKELGWKFKKGEIRASGVNLEFSFHRFSSIRVSVYWEYSSDKLYNHVLIHPNLTKEDWECKNSYYFRGRKITNQKRIEKYIKDVYKRFETPSINL